MHSVLCIAAVDREDAQAACEERGGGQVRTRIITPEQSKRWREAARKRDEPYRMARLNEVDSGVSLKEGQWWASITNLCAAVNRACEQWFRRRGMQDRIQWRDNWR